MTALGRVVPRSFAKISRYDIGIIDHGVLLEENSMEDLEKKNRKYIQLQVSDVHKTSLILEQQFRVTDYAVQDEHNLRLYDTALDMAAINKALVDRKSGQQGDFHALSQKIKGACAVKGDIARQYAGKNGRGCNNQHKADRVCQHHNEFAHRCVERSFCNAGRGCFEKEKVRCI